MRLFLVGKVAAEATEGLVWEFCGIYDSEERAVAECLDWRYFVAPVGLNETSPDKSEEFPEAYYPIPGGVEQHKVTGGMQ